VVGITLSQLVTGLSVQLAVFVKIMACMVICRSGSRKAEISFKCSVWVLTPQITLEHFVNLEHCIQNSIVMCQHIIAAFFNLEKVYDTTRQYNILRTLQERNLRGQLTLILLSSLQDCHFSDSATSFMLPMNMKMECHGNRL
jgi:hypothetical protein